MRICRGGGEDLLWGVKVERSEKAHSKAHPTSCAIRKGLSTPFELIKAKLSFGAYQALRGEREQNPHTKVMCAEMGFVEPTKLYVQFTLRLQSQK